MEFLLSSDGVTTSIFRFAALIAARKKYGPEASRSGGMRSPKVSFIPAQCVAGRAVARNRLGEMKQDEFIWKALPEKIKRAWRRKRKNHHDFELCVVSLGAALGGLCFFNGDLCEDRS